MTDEYDDDEVMMVNLNLKKVKVILHSKNEEGIDEYRRAELRELTGDERDGLFNVKAKKTKGTGKDFQVLDFKGLYSDLLKRTLFVSPLAHPTQEEAAEEFKDDNRPDLKKIEEKALLTYPVSTQKTLYEKAAKINAMTEEEKKEVGEDSGGERLKWYELALELGLPLQHLMRNTTSTEFVEWQKVLTLWDLKTQRQDYLFARLCWEIRRSSGEKNLPPVNKLLVSFTTEAQEKEQKSLSEQQVQRRVQESESAWGFFFASANSKLRPPLRVLKFPKEAG